ncbi:MAG: 50S ribosomal protein L9 [Anaerolineae bacterium]|jgi:large subunit ribosomal protein L9
MRVVLLKDVKRLGTVGEVRSVADGYARNYLIPRGLAVPATDAALEQVKADAASMRRRASQEHDQAKTLAERIDGVEIVFQAKAGETGRLYGSITNGDVAERLAEIAGEPVDKRKIQLEEPIKDLGSSDVQVKLHGDVVAHVTVIVEPIEES